MKQLSRELLDFIRRSPSCFHVVENLKNELLVAGYTELRESECWGVKPGGKYFVTRNGSSIIAFRVPEKVTGGFVMSASHSDSPSFKLKETAERRSAGCTQLSTEGYGGMLMATWFDRPLSVAGRVFVREGGKMVQKLVDIDRDLLIIPSVAIHMNRGANEGTKLLANVDTLPLYGGAEAGGIMPLAAASAGVAEGDILGKDLFLYCRTPGTVLGAAGEFIASPKLDDLECAFGCFRGFLAAEERGTIPVCCVFDNEEVGSATKQGAGSVFLRDTLRRIIRYLHILCIHRTVTICQLSLSVRKYSDIRLRSPGIRWHRCRYCSAKQTCCYGFITFHFLPPLYNYCNCNTNTPKIKKYPQSKVKCY